MLDGLRHRLWWSTQQKIITSAVVIVLLAAGIVYVVCLFMSDDRSCAAGVSRPQGSDECVGVSGGGYDFGRSQLTSVTAAIGRENSSLEKDRYVTVALLLPLTSTDPSMRTKVLRELQGAFAAQYRANHQSNGQVPKIRLALANTGANNLLWQPVVDRLKTMTGAPHRLRAVSSVATSSAQTKSAVKALTGAGIAVVGSTITADDIANGPGADTDPFPGLARVSPTNRDEARALTSFGEKIKAGKALLVQDTRQGDHYTDTLKSAFSALLKGSRYEPQLFTSREDPNDEGNTANTFEQITHLICDTDAEAVYFAGRHVQLRQFINALGARGCQNRSFLVLTGDEGSYLGRDKKLDLDALRHDVTVRYAALAHPDTWPAAAAAAKEKAQNAPTGGSADDYRAFTDLLETVGKKPVGPVGTIEKDDLTDGQVIIAHDAMTLAVAAIRRATTGGSQLPALEDVSSQWPQIKGSLRVRGASGWICLDNHGNPYNKAVPVVELAPDPPHQRFAALAWPEGRAPDTRCLTPAPTP
ncbi:hypothetical protein AB0D35_02305 [Streptomyces sp. NPDC048301]|uniref:ABC transporter substrate-binding protein n=1 Tax=unclassified Streptomyces TaxID=2593676 RepID=UPI0034451701